MNILIVKSDKAKLYPLMFKEYIQLKGLNCFISGSKKEETYKIIKENNLSVVNTLIYSRTAYPHTSNLFFQLEKNGFKVINPSNTLALTGNKYQTQIFAQKNKIPVANTFKVSKKNLAEIINILRSYPIIVAKPIYSQGRGIFCKKISYQVSKKEIAKTIFNIPGNEIIIQEYIPYQKLIRIIVVGFKVLEETTTYDIPKKWKASVCMNPNIKRYGQNSRLKSLAEQVAQAFTAPITYIDFFEDNSGNFILNEINTACSLIINERITGVKIHQIISDYLINELNIITQNTSRKHIFV